MITNKYEARVTCNQNKNRVIKHVNVNLKINACARKIIVGILAPVFEKIKNI